MKKSDGEHRYWHWHWHGIVQVLVIIAFGILFWFILLHMKEWNLAAPDILLLFFTGAAVVIAVICSHAYNHISEGGDPLYEQAGKLRAVWLHANFCWKTISIWMTVIPLYCTCVAIYLSGTPSGDEFDHIRILVYSILSLVISLGVYAIRPSNRASAYRKAYQTINKALIDYQETMPREHQPSNEEVVTDGQGFRTDDQKLQANGQQEQKVRSKLVKAMKKGESYITKQDIQDPK